MVESREIPKAVSGGLQTFPKLTLIVFKEIAIDTVLEANMVMVPEVTGFQFLSRRLCSLRHWNVDSLHAGRGYSDPESPASEKFR